jgi:hypothetical protein
MLSKILFGWLPSSIVLLSLAGCAEFDQRKGPAPIIDGIAVQTASSNKYWILNALAIDANVHDGNPDYYYLVTEAGFNYVDDQCRSYFDSLFFLERRRDELKSGLAASAATTAAILGVTHASTPSLAIVAAAFGLASSATDIVAGTYLYRLPPATTQGFVEKLQLAYRAEAAKNRVLINSPTSAYYQIQRYLDLCLPPTIEAEITKQISSTVAFGVPTGGGAFFSIDTMSPPPASPHRFIGPSPLTREQVRKERIGSVVKEPARPGPHISRNITEPAFVRQVQAALCVSPVDGALGEPTRLAIQDYLRGRRKPVPDHIDPLDPVLQPRLQEAVDNVGNCSAEGFRNPYEVGGYGVPSDKTASKIKTLQENMNKELSIRRSTTRVEQTGEFDAQTRNAIAELRPKLVPGTTGDYIDKPLDILLH